MLPESIFKEWRPAKAIELLTKLEPESEFDSTFCIYKNEDDFEPKNLVTELQ